MPTRSELDELRQSHETLQRTVERYRAAVEQMMVARYDLELTALHLKRTGISVEQSSHCETMARELRWRLMPFEAIEPGFYIEMAERLQKEFVRRDEFNTHLHELGKRKRSRGHGNGNGNGKHGAGKHEPKR